MVQTVTDGMLVALILFQLWITVTIKTANPLSAFVYKFFPSILLFGAILNRLMYYGFIIHV